MPVLAAGVAIAYDFTGHLWPDELRQRTSPALLQIAREMDHSMGRGHNRRIANNWQAVRWGAAGLAALACDEPDGRAFAGECLAKIVRHFEANGGGALESGERLPALSPWIQWPLRHGSRARRPR